MSKKMKLEFNGTPVFVEMSIKAQIWWWLYTNIFRWFDWNYNK